MTEQRYYNQEIAQRMEGLTVEEQKREALVTALRSGKVRVQVGGQSIVFRESVSDVGNNKKHLKITAFNEASPQNPICFISAEYTTGKPIAFNFKKDYVGNQEKLEGKGIITTGSALLAQVLILESVTEMRGEIWESNEQSFNTRLKMPDYVRGGHFTHKIFNDPEGEGLQTLVTYFNKTPILQPQTYKNGRLI